MIAFNAPVFTAVILAISGVNAYRTDYVTGHDFDFSVTYPSGLTFSTTERPTDVLSATDIGAKEPLVTLTDPDGTGRDDRYVAFVEISYIPTIDSINDVIYEFPWIESNLTVLSNGTLTPDVYDSGRITYFHTIWTNEVRNATLHVWKQTPELVDFLLDNSFAGTFWQLALVWSNTTSKISYDFPRSNIDFKIRNGTGEDRGGIDDNGASIVGWVSSSTSAGTSATALPTDAPATTTGSGSVPASTTGAASPTETPNGASSLMAASGVLFLAPVVLAML